MIVKGIKTCNHCGKQYISYSKNRKYCSQKCWSFYRAKNLKDWIKSEKIAKRNKDANFRKLVSNGLKKYYHNQRLIIANEEKEVTDFRLRKWRGLRNCVFTKYGKRCLRCKTTEKRIDIHHIIPIRAGGENSVYNLIPLCRNCHQFLEKNQYGINGIIQNWVITRLLVKESFLINR